MQLSGSEDKLVVHISKLNPVNLNDDHGHTQLAYIKERTSEILCCIVVAPHIPPIPFAPTGRENRKKGSEFVFSDVTYRRCADF